MKTDEIAEDFLEIRDRGNFDVLMGVAYQGRPDIAPAALGMGYQTADTGMGFPLTHGSFQHYHLRLGKDEFFLGRRELKNQIIFLDGFSHRLALPMTMLPRLTDSCLPDRPGIAAA